MTAPGRMREVKQNIDARLPLLDFAPSLGCIWIKFDGAASVIDELPTFDW